MKFRIFPTPRYLRSKKKVKPKEMIKPLLELPRIIENKKRRAEKIRRKKRGTAKEYDGSIK